MPVVLPLCSAAGDTQEQGDDAQSQNAQRQETSFPKAAPRPGEQSARGKEQGQVTFLQHGRSMPRRVEGSEQAMPSYTFLSPGARSMVDLRGPCHCLSPEPEERAILDLHHHLLPPPPHPPLPSTAVKNSIIQRRLTFKHPNF